MNKKLEHNISQYSQHEYFNEKLERLEIDLAVKDAVHVFQNCDINDCYIYVNSDSKCTPNILSGSRWSNCTFHAKKELSLSTIEADFEKCKFKGKWSGRIKGKVENCDFSDSNLINFTFYNNETIGTNVFSENNTAIIESAGKHSKEIKELLSGKSKLGLHIRPDVGLFIFNIANHKDSKTLYELLAGLPYVKFAKKA